MAVKQQTDKHMERRRRLWDIAADNGALAALYEVIIYGPQLRSVMEARFGRRALEWSVRMLWLRPVRLAEVGQEAYVLDLEGRRHIGKRWPYEPRASGILDGLARRAVRECYEQHGWREEPGLGPLLRFAHFEADVPPRFVLASYTGYSVLHVGNLLSEHAGAVHRAGGVIVVYVRTADEARAMARAHRHRIQVWPYWPALASVPGDLRKVLLAVSAEAFEPPQDDPHEPTADMLQEMLA